MTFTITPLVWDGTSRNIPIPKTPPLGMMTYKAAALHFEYTEQHIRQLVSAGRIFGGGGFVKIESMRSWANGRKCVPAK